MDEGGVDGEGVGAGGNGWKDSLALLHYLYLSALLFSPYIVKFVLWKQSGAAALTVAFTAVSVISQHEPQFCLVVNYCLAKMDVWRPFASSSFSAVLSTALYSDRMKIFFWTKMEKRNLDIKKSEKFCLCTWEIGKIRKLKGQQGLFL